MSSFRNSAARVRWLCLVLKLSPVEVNTAELQCRTRPVDRRGAVFGRKRAFLILGNPFKSGFIICDSSHFNYLVPC